ncbi:hypothetical protein Q6274_29375, partial [Klebsiella pneumoniae]|nr:hypothetical protein [Klebsiella pneumoniae]
VSRQQIDAPWRIKEREIHVNTNDRTEQGKKYYKQDAAKKMRGENLGGFCFGKATVTYVSNFTEPSDAMGQIISRVT